MRGSRDAYDRDKEFIMSWDLRMVDGVMWPLFIGFICLEFLDVYSTLLAKSLGPSFFELNPIASSLFSLGFNGFLVALVLKFSPALPLFYAVFAKDTKNGYAHEIRVVKFAALVALISANLLLLYVVAVNNLPLLLRESLR